MGESKEPGSSDFFTTLASWLLLSIDLRGEWAFTPIRVKDPIRE
jgi:hypothetical protein